jgi:UDP-N-acetylmuramate dehydrogenase
MIRLIENADLQPHNTFGIPVRADMFYEFTESAELTDFLDRFELPEKTLVLGGGSNILFTKQFDGLILYPNIPGIIEVDEDRSHVYIEAGAGVEWDELVAYTVARGLGGLENLSLIPGRVGASPVQNIGAYGAEAKDCIEHVRAVSLEKGHKVEFSKEECEFGYRSSLFKNQMKGKVVITSVLFKLDKFPQFNIEYGDVKAEVERLGGVNGLNIRKAIVSIRESKLPDPKVLGNAGSFFKNPVVEIEKAEALRKLFPEVPLYESSDEGKLKVAAGWLIDRCGWKGKRIGDAGVHKHQALVLVNYGNATGSEILNLSELIRTSVYETFGIGLESEVNII